MRFLYVVPPFAGHVNPTVSVAAELTRRGHEVAWCVPAAGRALLPPDATVFPAGTEPVGGYADLHARWLGLRGVAALRFLIEEALVPLARAMLPDVEAAVRAWRPDVLVCDQQAFAGPAAAVRADLPWATSATTSAEFTRPLLGLPKIEEWVRGQLGALMGEIVTDHPAAMPDPRFSDRLVVVFSTPELVGRTDPVPRHHRYVGPAFGAPRPHVPFPWDALDPVRQRVLVSLGTLNGEAGQRFYAAVIEGTRDTDVQVVVAGPRTALGALPDHVIWCERVPQTALLPHLDAVVTHGGHNTVCESLAFGLPLVVAPIRDDQPVTARQVAEAGAGVHVRFGRARAAELHDAVTAVLARPEYRHGARRIQASFAAAGGAPAAADALESLR